MKDHAGRIEELRPDSFSNITSASAPRCTKHPPSLRRSHGPQCSCTTKISKAANFGSNTVMRLISTFLENGFHIFWRYLRQPKLSHLPFAIVPINILIHIQLSRNTFRFIMFIYILPIAWRLYVIGFVTCILGMTFQFGEHEWLDTILCNHMTATNECRLF